MTLVGMPRMRNTQYVQGDTATYVDLLCDALGVAASVQGGPPGVSGQQVDEALATADASIRAACVPPGGAACAVDFHQSRRQDHSAWCVAVAAGAAALRAVAAASHGVIPSGADANTHAARWQSLLAGVLHRLGGCAATAFPGTRLAGEVVLLRHVARTTVHSADMGASSPGVDAVACGVSDDGTLAVVLAGTHAAGGHDAGHAAPHVSPPPSMHDLWRLSGAQAHDVPLLLAAVGGCAAPQAGPADGDVYLAVAACVRAATRLMRDSTRDVVGASDVLARVAAAWPAPGALVCALPGGAKAVAADGRGVSVELMGVATDADFDAVVKMWRATREAAAGRTDAGAAEATAAAVAADDGDLFFFDTAGDGTAAPDGGGDGEHAADLDAWMGEPADGEGAADGAVDEEEEP